MLLQNACCTNILLKLSYQRKIIQPAARDGRSSTKVFRNLVSESNKRGRDKIRARSLGCFFRASHSHVEHLWLRAGRKSTSKDRDGPMPTLTAAEVRSFQLICIWILTILSLGCLGFSCAFRRIGRIEVSLRGLRPRGGEPLGVGRRRPALGSGPCKGRPGFLLPGRESPTGPTG